MADGPDVYAVNVIKHLEKITTLSSGPALLQKIRETGKLIKIVMADTSGNACGYSDPRAKSPLLVQAIDSKNADMFRNELKMALGTAKKKGIPTDFFARQLTEGLTPVTYRAEKNLAMTGGRTTAPAGSSGAQVMAFHANVAMKNLGYLLDFAEGRLKVDLLYAEFAAWRPELPRLLRPFLTPGRGSNAIIYFDPGDWKPCALDPAMKNRHPALGLVHEMIHAWHAMTGKNMNVRIGKENLEEVITTGLPPYNSEEYSDNKFRTEFGPAVNLRMKY